MARRPPERRISDSADPPSTTRTVRLRPGGLAGWAIFSLVFGCLWLFLGVLAIASPSSMGNNPPSPTGAPDALEEIATFAAGVGFAWLGIRVLRIGVKATPGKLIIRNMWRTRVVAASDIRVINLEPEETSDGVPRWMPRVLLADESSIWLDYFRGGPATKAPQPRLAARVGEARRLLGVAGDVSPFLDPPPPDSVAAGPDQSR